MFSFKKYYLRLLLLQKYCQRLTEYLTRVNSMEKGIKYLDTINKGDGKNNGRIRWENLVTVISALKYTVVVQLWGCLAPQWD